MTTGPEPKPFVPTHPATWLGDLWTTGRLRLRPQTRLLVLSLVVGLLTGLGAVVFHSACQVVFHYALEEGVGYHPQAPGGEAPLFADATTPLRPWLFLLVPTLGGLLSGWIVVTFAPEAEGHGTDAAIEAYHHSQGRIRARVPLVKIIASALTLGTGGSGGREGPIAQIGAGVGSFLAQFLRLRVSERRILLAAGMGAGVAAIFRAPLAGTLFAAEILYSSIDFEYELLIPAGLASVTAFCTFGIFFQGASLFNIPPEVLATLKFKSPLELAPYTLLALFLVVLAMIYVRSFYGITYVFHQLPLNRYLKAPLGAFLTGALGLGLFYLFGQKTPVLAVLSFGYGILQNALAGGHTGRDFALVLLAVAFGKIFTTGLTIGSGGSGGVFGPSMVIGGCGGGAVGIALHAIWPELVPQPICFVIVGMAGFFAAAAKTPFSTLVIVCEMTGNYDLLVPAMWVCFLCFLLADEGSLYHNQVSSRSLSPVHQGAYVREVLASLLVRPFITPLAAAAPLRPGDRLGELIERLSRDGFQALPVVDDQNRLLGVVSQEEVILASRTPDLKPLVVAADLMRSRVSPLRAGDRLDRAMELFVENDLLVLPVVGDTPDRTVIGVVKRGDVAAAYLRQMHGSRQAETEDSTTPV